MSINERKMADKAIRKTYKGILRVSNNINLMPGEEDVFLNNEYYITNFDKSWTGNGEQKTYDYLSEGVSIERFKSATDLYSNLKLPVTDSMGNFLNFSLGTDGALIGTNTKAGILRVTESQFNENDETTFAIVSTETPLYIGLSERELLNSKHIVGGNISVENDNNISGNIIIENQYVHSDNKLSNTSETVRTIVPAFESIKKYDAIGYNQENYILNENKKDCFIELTNLKEYIEEKVNHYLGANTAQVPTGTIINQYSSLDKWFCSTSTGCDDINSWQGFRPAMRSEIATPYAHLNLSNGRAIYSDNYLYYNSSADGDKTSELPPDFKRKYILCDGNAVNFTLYPDYIQALEKSDREGLNLFFDLFYVIGHYYWNDKTQSSKVPPIHACYQAGIDTNNNPYYRYYDDIKADNIWNTKVDPNVVYGITMATVLAFKAFNNKIAKNNTQFDTPEAAIEWLKTQNIPEEYVFNVIAPEESGLLNDYFKYTNSTLNGKTAYINIGREVKSFSDTIPYYTFDKNTKAVTLTTTTLYNMAEVYDIADLFINRRLVDENSGTKDRSWEWNNYRYTFYVPQLYTETDPNVNIAYAYNNKGANGSVNTALYTTVGQFMGSNGLLIADELTLKHTNTTINLDKFSQSFVTNYTSVIGRTPHAHALAKGDTALQPTETSLESTGDTPPEDWKEGVMGLKYYPKNDNTSRVANFKQPKFIKTNTISGDEPANEVVLGANYFNYTPKEAYKEYLSADIMNNYILQEVQGSSVKLSEIANSFSGTYGYEYTNSGYEWYGRTSEPIWAENKNANKTEKFNDGMSVGYFRPESIKLLPLIKL